MSRSRRTGTIEDRLAEIVAHVGGREFRIETDHHWKSWELSVNVGGSGREHQAAKDWRSLGYLDATAAAPTLERLVAVAERCIDRDVARAVLPKTESA